MCDPKECSHCHYIGEGDSLCDVSGEIVMSDWTPTKHYMGPGCIELSDLLHGSREKTGKGTKKNALVVQTEASEKALGSKTTVIVQAAQSTVIKTQEDYETAAGTLKEVKCLQKQVKEYWEPLRVSAKKAYDGVLEKKKQMTEPLDKVERILKGLMSSYTVEQERKRTEREAAMRAAARKEAERIMEQAAAAEEAGDAAGAEAAMEEAMVMDEAAAAGRIMASAPKAAGVSTSKTWKIVSIDPDKVPVKVGAVEIRPVDQAAVMRLIREAKGNIEIPGVKFEESVQISVRG